MSATSAPKITLFIFYITVSVVYNEKLRIASVIYIKIKKFIIYSIYFADMQTFYKKSLILCSTVVSAFVCNISFCMSAFIFMCRHTDIKVYKLTIVTLNLLHKPYFIANYSYISYKVQFLRHSKNFVINCQK